MEISFMFGWFLGAMSTILLAFVVVWSMKK